MPSGMRIMKEMTDTEAPMTGVVEAPTCAHLAQSTEETAVLIMIDVHGILGTVGVMGSRSIGEALFMIVTRGTEALFMIVTTGAEAQFMIVTTGAEALVTVGMKGGEALVIINTR
jgi:hypothetical protein